MTTLRVVLYQPEIPQNTGNIVRTCAAQGAGLTLIEPLGFRLSNRLLKRAGLDYWLGVDVERSDNLEAVICNHPFYLFSSKANRLYTDIQYEPNAHLVFGSETQGLPTELLEQYPDRCVTLPMRPSQRCLNLSNAVAIALYEAWRQQGFD